jgi:hypothetical protein
MFLFKVIYRLYLLGAYLGLWQGQHLAPFDAALQLGHPVAGVALRQGRRFNMEDRVVINMSSLPGGRLCPAVNFTYAAGARLAVEVQPRQLCLLPWGEVTSPSVLAT